MEGNVNDNQFVTYLLGAGASANALPVVKDIPKRLKTFKDVVSQLNANSQKMITSSDIHKKSPNPLLNDIDWIINEIGDHQSIDTFAKKLYVTKEKGDLLRLKILLSLFFILEQIDKNDLRYDTFIASIFVKDDISPKVRILNWNYDYQFEKAYSQYCRISKLDIIQEKLFVYPTPFKISPLTKFDDVQRTKMVKLNGTTAFINDEQEIVNILNDLSTQKKDISLKFILDTYYRPNWNPCIRFAWEYNSFPESFKLASEIELIAQKTQALVIIGYSFPFFNRQIDRMIFEKLNTHTIYIQDLDPEGIKDRLLGGIIKKTDIWNFKLFKDTKQFLLPYEL